ncbi:MAG: sensor domain-containing diguanylate cyclase [Legionellaceae bacterium]|nr:sensor domain-containing diguanylate cyclase [Legionellaceae bacterium]
MPDSKSISNQQWTSQFILSNIFTSFINLIPDAVILSNVDGEIILTNVTAQETFGYSEEEFLKLVIEDLVPGNIHDHHVDLRKWFFDNPKPRFLQNRYYELCAVRKNNDEFPIESSLFAIESDNGLIAVNILRDVSSKKDKENEIRNFAYIDSLTKLPNRRYFDENFSQKASMAIRNKQKIALFFIDLDYFKEVNDEYGHEAGDKVLQEISRRLDSITRKEDFLARIGGDEFIIIVYPSPTVTKIKILAQRLRDACHRPIELDNCSCKLSSSIGVSISKKGVVDTTRLFIAADHAMYEAKKVGKDGYFIDIS